MRILLPLILLGLAISLSSAHAHVEMLPIDVLALNCDTERGHYSIRFRAITTDYVTRINLPKKEREYTVHLQVDPRSPSTLEARRGMELIQQRYQKSSKLIIGRMSSKGWLPITGRKGEFESVSVKIHRPKDTTSDEDAIVYFIH